MNQVKNKHMMNCGALGFDGDDAGECTCGLAWRIKLQTEQEMHAAWRKRAEESEIKESETAKILAWLGMIVDTYDIQLGEFESSFDEHKQIQTWHCFGCNAEHYAKWPDWKLDFIHKSECMYIKLRTLLDAALKLV